MKRSVICIWSQNSKIGGLEGTEHWKLHVKREKEKRTHKKGLVRRGKEFRQESLIETMRKLRAVRQMQ